MAAKHLRILSVWILSALGHFQLTEGSFVHLPQAYIYSNKGALLAMKEAKNTDDRLIVSSMALLQTNNIRLILASQSPRRREILDMMGLKGNYMAEPSPLDEASLQSQLAAQNLSPIEYTRILAEEKAKALAVALQQRIDQENQGMNGYLVIGSDTIVDLNGKILEKPAGPDEAKRMLEQLSGNAHKVHTGVAICMLNSNSNEYSLFSSFVDTAKVQFARLSEGDIDAYVKTGEPLDKAGSYGIQGIGGQLVQGIEGDFFTVMGLPMHRVSKAVSSAVSTMAVKMSV